jgi:arylformamidase
VAVERVHQLSPSQPFAATDFESYPMMLHTDAAELIDCECTPEHLSISERWSILAAAYRLAGDTQLNQSYGPRERHRYDLFHAADKEQAPLVVYIHGGHWQGGDRRDYSFVARELNANGITVAIPSYSLCPVASVMEIADEIQLCLATLWKRSKKRPTVVGHSAGGHLAAEMLARDWRRFAGVPGDLVRTGYAMSGIFDLGPLIRTDLNEVLGLTPGTARAVSPLFRPPPPRGRRFVAAVGTDEDEELLRQGRAIAANWSKVGIEASCEVVAGTNHLTIIDELITPDSSILNQIVALARKQHEAVHGGDPRSDGRV